MKNKKNEKNPKTDVKVVAKFYDGTECEFSISVKSIHGGLYDMLRMFAAYFASLEYYKLKFRTCF